MSCYQREAHVPPIVLDLGHQLSQTQDLSCRIANDLLDSVSQLCELRASIKDRSLINPPTIITSLLNLDAAVVKWAAERASRWDYSTVFDSTKPDLIYDDSYSVYSTYWIAGTWNIQRGTRVFVQEAILAQINALLTKPQSTTTTLLLLSQRSRSLATISELASDICASVPYLLGHDKPYHEQISNPAPAVCGYFLVTSLYLAGSTIGVPRSMRFYVLGRLKYIGHVLGIQQSLLLAEILQRKIELGKEEEMEGLPRQFQSGPCRDRGEEQESERDWEPRVGLGAEDEDPNCDFGGRLAGFPGSWEYKRVGLGMNVV